MTAAYDVQYCAAVIAEDFPALDDQTVEQLNQALQSRVLKDPLTYGRPLRFSHYHQRRFTVNGFDVVYFLQVKTKTVIISVVRPRQASAFQSEET